VALPRDGAVRGVIGSCKPSIKPVAGTPMDSKTRAICARASSSALPRAVSLSSASRLRTHHMKTQLNPSARSTLRITTARSTAASMNARGSGGLAGEGWGGTGGGVGGGDTGGGGDGAEKGCSTCAGVLRDTTFTPVTTSRARGLLAYAWTRRNVMLAALSSDCTIRTSMSILAERTDTWMAVSGTFRSAAREVMK